MVSLLEKNAHLQNLKITWKINLLDQAGPTPDDENALSEALEKNDSLRSLEIQDTSEAHIGRRKKKLQHNQAWQASRVALAATCRTASAQLVPDLEQCEMRNLIFAFLFPQLPGRWPHCLATERREQVLPCVSGSSTQRVQDVARLCLRND